MKTYAHVCLYKGDKPLFSVRYELKYKKLPTSYISRLTQDKFGKYIIYGALKAVSHIACRAHAVPLPRCAAKG